MPDSCPYELAQQTLLRPEFEIGQSHLLPSLSKLMPYMRNAARPFKALGKACASTSTALNEDYFRKMTAVSRTTPSLCLRSLSNSSAQQNAQCSVNRVIAKGWRALNLPTRRTDFMSASLSAALQESGSPWASSANHKPKRKNPENCFEHGVRCWVEGCRRSAAL